MCVQEKNRVLLFIHTFVFFERWAKLLINE